MFGNLPPATWSPLQLVVFARFTNRVIHGTVCRRSDDGLAMSSTARVTQFAKQDLWTTDLATVPLFQRVSIQALRLVIAVGLEFRHRLLDARAAGLVYTTL